MKLLRKGYEIEFRPPTWGKYKNRFRPLMRGIIIGDFYTPNGGTHLFIIKTKKGKLTMNGASLYPHAKVISMNLEQVINSFRNEEQSSGFNTMTLNRAS